MKTSEHRLQRLEALLDRVRRRATEARRPITRLLDAALTRSEPPAAEPVPPPVLVEPPREPEPPRAAEPNLVPFTVVPASLELVDTPPPEALGEEDFLDEIPSDMLESVPPSGGVIDISRQRAALDDDDDDDLEPPASSQRPRASALLADSLLDAAPEPFLDEGREVPLKTPPPESGPQEAPMPSGFGAHPIPEDVEGMLEAELPPLAALNDGAGFDSLEAPFAVSMPSPAAAPALGPTVEQLGQTIDLDEAAGPALELDAPPTSAPPPPIKSEELEAPLPARESAGRYDEELMPPPEAREELEAHRDRVGESTAIAAPPILEGLTPPSAFEPEMTTLSGVAESGSAEVSAPVGPEVIGRPPLESGVVFAVRPSDQPVPRPSTFLELLDGSITLGG